MNTNTMTAPSTIPPGRTERQQAPLAISEAFLALDAAFERLPDEDFHALPQCYKDLADAVLTCYWGQPDLAIEVSAGRM